MEETLIERWLTNIITDRPSEILESDSPMTSGHNPTIGRESPANV